MEAEELSDFERRLLEEEVEALIERLREEIQDLQELRSSLQGVFNLNR